MSTRIVRYKIPTTAGPSSLRWALTFPATPSFSSESQANSVTSNGSVSVVAGIFTNGSVEIKTTSGSSRTLSLSPDGPMYIAKYNSDGVLQWARNFGGPGRTIAVNAVHMDNQGNVLVTGNFKGIFNFGGGDRSTTGGSFGSSLFVAKYSGANGNWIWDQVFGSSNGGASGFGVVTDTAVPPNVYVTGTFTVIIDLGGGNLTSRGSSDVFIQKYDGATGNPLWSPAVQVGGSSGDFVKAIAIGPDGHIVICGYTFGTINFGGGERPNDGTQAFYVAKFSGSTGAYIWDVMKAPEDNAAGTNGVAIDNDGNVIIGGSVRDSIDLGGGFTINGENSSAFFLAKYNSSGTIQWGYAFGGINSFGGESVTSVATDAALPAPAGNIFMVGIAKGDVDFGSGDYTAGNGSGNLLICKFSPSGVSAWPRQKRIPAVGGAPSASDITVDNTGNPIVCGFFTGKMDLGNGEIDAAATKDAYLVSYQS